jgi:hypothetical protein
MDIKMKERIFLDKIRKNKIKNPLQRDFSIEKWLKDYEENLSLEDVEIFQAGLIFNLTLTEVRVELKKLYEEENPFSSYDELIKFYFSLSNRDKSLLLTQMKEKTSSLSNLFNATFNNNPLENELTANDVSTMCVDGLSKAIHNCIKKNDKGDKLKVSKNPLSKIEFAKKEGYLSQIYETIENYWYSIALNDYKFLNKKIEDDTFYIVEEPNSEYEQILLISSERRMRISTHTSLISANNSSIGNLVKNTLKYVKNNKAFKIINSKDIEDEILFSYISLKSQEVYLSDYIPQEFLENKYSNEFSILDILKVFNQLSLLAIQYLKDYAGIDTDIDIDTSDDGIKKLLKFCPSLKKVKITKSIAQAIGFKYKQVEKILFFLEYKGINKNDFWCNPLYSISATEYILLASAIDSPILLRTVEHWLVQLNIPLDMKGIHYEKNIISEFNEILNEKLEIKKFNNAITKKIKLGSKTEEIDFLSRIGNKILIGEAKCIVVSDSPNSEYRTFETLQGASNQVNRKKKFIEENLQELFKKLKWEYNDKENYELIGFVLNSNKTFVGLNIDGISIIDEKILFNYFKSNISPLATAEGKKDLAWFVLYENFEEMLNNFSTYIHNPPPIIIHKNSFTRDYIKTPPLTKDSNKITLSRLLKQEVDILQILKREYVFPIQTVSDIEKYLEDEYFSI